MRHLSYNTIGKLLMDLEKAGLKIPRATFYNLEKRGTFPKYNRRTTGNWRVFTDEEALTIKRAIWENYKGTKYTGQ
jgi:hypothetical protein